MTFLNDLEGEFKKSEGLQRIDRKTDPPLDEKQIHYESKEEKFDAKIKMMVEN